ncbi:MAG TPA: ABC transporter substrate-binding protein [Candidatus Omnitrophota bacterium]|nr:ABC transporter substrate-binding protein [Candidatus Omnitrophota bacterium]
MRRQNQELRTKNQVSFLRIIFCLGSWFLVLGSFSAHGAERIVSLNACTDELLLQLALPEQVAGVTRFNHSPQSSEVLNQNPHISKLSSDVESIMKTNPSVVLAGPFSNPLLINQLKQLNIPIVHLAVPGNWSDLDKAVGQVSALLKRVPAGEVLQKKIRELSRFDGQTRWQGKRAVFWSAAGHVSGKNTFENTVLTTLGLINVSETEGYAFLSVEKLIQLKPAVIIVTQNPELKNSWSHETLFHPALKKALPKIEYLHIPEEAVSCASEYTVEVVGKLIADAKA